MVPTRPKRPSSRGDTALRCQPLRPGLIEGIPLWRRRLARCALGLALVGAVIGSQPAGALTQREFETPSGSTRSVARIPYDHIRLDPCPPLCSATVFARLNPSEVYEPIEPDEWTFDSASQVVWGGAEADFWLVWGPDAQDRMVVWDESMWIDPAQEFVGEAFDSAAASSRYGISRELKIQAPRQDRTRRLRRGHVIRYGNFAAQGPPPELELHEIPPQVYAPSTRSRLRDLLTKLSNSRSAVAGFTLLLIWLMIRLVR